MVKKNYQKNINMINVDFKIDKMANNFLGLLNIKYILSMNQIYLQTTKLSPILQKVNCKLKKKFSFDKTGLDTKTTI